MTVREPEYLSLNCYMLAPSRAKQSVYPLDKQDIAREFSSLKLRVYS